MSPADFVERQYHCRQLRESMLSPAGFFTSFGHHVESAGLCAAATKPTLPGLQK